VQSKGNALTFLSFLPPFREHDQTESRSGSASRILDRFLGPVINDPFLRILGRLPQCFRKRELRPKAYAHEEAVEVIKLSGLHEYKYKPECGDPDAIISDRVRERVWKNREAKLQHLSDTDLILEREQQANPADVAKAHKEILAEIETAAEQDARLELTNVAPDRAT
jgi:hypothetical protein